MDTAPSVWATRIRPGQVNPSGATNGVVVDISGRFRVGGRGGDVPDLAAIDVPDEGRPVVEDVQGRAGVADPDEERRLGGGHRLAPVEGGPRLGGPGALFSAHDDEYRWPIPLCLVATGSACHEMRREGGVSEGSPGADASGRWNGFAHTGTVV